MSYKNTKKPSLSNLNPNSNLNKPSFSSSVITRKVVFSFPNFALTKIMKSKLTLIAVSAKLSLKEKDVSLKKRNLVALKRFNYPLES